jgi:hypothetical protein
MNLGVNKGGKFLHWLINYQVLKDDSAPELVSPEVLKLWGAVGPLREELIV